MRSASSWWTAPPTRCVPRRPASVSWPRRVRRSPRPTGLSPPWRPTANELATTLRVGFITASAGPFTPRMLDELRREVPDVSVRLTELPWPQQALAVREGVVDAALVVRPPITEAAGLRLEVVRHEARVVALPVTHRLAARAEVSLTDLDGEPHVTSDEADPAWVR
ncbi:LysR family substrate-binding domain-containing protein [Streptomyces sp. NPDC002845]